MQQFREKLEAAETENMVNNQHLLDCINQILEISRIIYKKNIKPCGTSQQEVSLLGRKSEVQD